MTQNKRTTWKETIDSHPVITAIVIGAACGTGGFAICHKWNDTTIAQKNSTIELKESEIASLQRATIDLVSLRAERGQLVRERDIAQQEIEGLQEQIEGLRSVRVTPVVAARPIESPLRFVGQPVVTGQKTNYFRHEHATFTFTVENPTNERIQIRHGELMPLVIDSSPAPEISTKVAFGEMEHDGHIYVPMSEPNNCRTIPVAIPLEIEPHSEATFTLWFDLPGGAYRSDIGFTLVRMRLLLVHDNASLESPEFEVALCHEPPNYNFVGDAGD